MSLVFSPLVEHLGSIDLFKKPGTAHRVLARAICLSESSFLIEGTQCWHLDMKAEADVCVSELQGMEADLQLTIKLTKGHT